MKQPNEYWLKYMLTFSGLRRGQIIELAEMYGMVPPSAGYLSELNSKLDETKPAPFRLNSSGVLSWVRRQRFMSLYREDTEAVQARSILGDDKKRLIIEALTLTETPVGTISEYLSLLCNSDVSSGTVALYQHYFWNPKIMSLRGWYDYLEAYPEGKLFKGCFSKGEEFALWKLGYRIDVSKESILKSVFHESSMRFMELSGKPNNRHTALTAKLWAENIFKANEEIERTGDAAKEILGELRGIAIKLGKRDISSIEDLRGEDE